MLIVRTPLRLSLFGGGTDFPSYFNQHGGCVLSTAINKYIYVILKPREDKRVRVSCTHIQTVSHVKNLKHELIREAMNLVGLDRSLEIYTIGDVPAGTGLGSSSSVTVGLLKAMHTYVGDDAPAEQIAKEACEIETKILNKPIGFQDQYAAAYGGLHFITFSKDGVSMGKSMTRELHDLKDRMMLFFTGITRKSSDILSEQNSKVGINIELLDGIRDIAYEAMNSLNRRDFVSAGGFLDRSWRLKKDLASGITNPRLEELYSRALKAGALGGKIAGAGGGGYLLTYSPPECKDAIRKTLKLRELLFDFEEEGTKVVYSK